jgi:hypothetical protein
MGRNLWIGGQGGFRFMKITYTKVKKADSNNNAFYQCSECKKIFNENMLFEHKLDHQEDDLWKYYKKQRELIQKLDSSKN